MKSHLMQGKIKNLLPMRACLAFFCYGSRATQLLLPAKKRHTQKKAAGTQT
jgi:hypothetical protein